MRLSRHQRLACMASLAVCQVLLPGSADAWAESHSPDGGATEEPPTWAIGIESGANFSYPSSQPSREGDPLAGVMVAVSLRRFIGPVFALRTELRYVQKGMRGMLLRMGGQQVRGTLALDYVELPLLIEARLGSSGLIPYLNLGPLFSIAVNRSFTSDGVMLLGLDQSQNFQSYDISFELGAGVEFALTPRFNLFVQARAALGLIDIDGALSSYHSRSLGLSGGVVFRL
jgi:hypothetical protein